ncbi:hypothetical protein ACQ33O_07270 [Ferruginibacter sp. SUN002]|uniref:hypothetical protein n=1 Tax=Ferruginibacter sp. SUN002 TaxID=2937789 RepID=UPI003D36F2C8
MSFIMYAQSSKTETVPDRVFLGLGAGLDYGGFGLRSEFVITKNVSIFGGAGYNLVDVAYNVGAIYNFLPDKRVCPTFLAMYGYNAALKFKDRPDLSKTYYGFNLGVGCQIKDRDFKNRWAIEVLLPFRSDAFEKDYDYYKPILESKLLPITITIGRNFALRKRSK